MVGKHAHYLKSSTAGLIRVRIVGVHGESVVRPLADKQDLLSLLSYRKGGARCVRHQRQEIVEFIVVLHGEIGACATKSQGSKVEIQRLPRSLMMVTWVKVRT